MFFGPALCSGTSLLIRRLGGYGRVKFRRPWASARGYPEPQLRCSIGKTCSRRFLT